LRFAILTTADLAAADLSGADLAHARLDQADLKGESRQFLPRLRQPHRRRSVRTFSAPRELAFHEPGGGKS
jgi:hypothetical protein